MSARVEKLISEYPQMVSQKKCLAYQIAHFRGLSPEDVIERVKYLIAHHHTYSNIQGIDLQILIEADFLVNLYEHSDESVASKVLEKIFKTASGTKLCKTMFRL